TPTLSPRLNLNDFIFSLHPQFVSDLQLIRQMGLTGRVRVIHRGPCSATNKLWPLHAAWKSLTNAVGFLSQRRKAGAAPYSQRRLCLRAASSMLVPLFK